MPEHIGFTGTQEGLSDLQGETLCQMLTTARRGGIEWMHNGDCIGADAMAAEIWSAIGGKIWLHPPDNPKKRAFLKADRIEAPLPYLERNKMIVLKSWQLIACPKESRPVLRSGTWSIIRRAHRIGKPTSIIHPDGSITTSRFSTYRTVY